MTMALLAPYSFTRLDFTEPFYIDFDLILPMDDKHHSIDSIMFLKIFMFVFAQSLFQKSPRKRASTTIATRPMMFGTPRSYRSNECSCTGINGWTISIKIESLIADGYIIAFDNS
jgi:hypothetical protein